MRRLLLALGFLGIAAPAGARLPITNGVALAPAFYVASSGGSDSNAGTIAAPFATLGKCQTSMRASGTIKTCYLRAGTYAMTPSTVLALDSSDNGETWSTYPLDASYSAIMQYSAANDSLVSVDTATNVTLTNLTFDGHSAAAPAGDQAIQILSGNNIHVTHNRFINNSGQGDISVYNSDSIYIQRNLSDLNELQFLTAIFNDATEHQHFFVTDNTIRHHVGEFNDLYMSGTEILSLSDYHVDRNIVVTDLTIETINISIVDFISTISCNTIYGNQIGGNHDNNFGIEVSALAGTTKVTYVANNVSPAPSDPANPVFAPFSIGQCVLCAIENNDLSGFTDDVFSEDGGYNGTEWIGDNIQNGATVTGWPGHSYGASPGTCNPSAVAP